MIFLLFVLAALGVVLIVSAFFSKRNIVYVGDESSKALRLKKEGIVLAGKPDFIKRIDGNYIPIEFKSSRPSPAKIEGIKFQLAAYFELIKENYGVVPPYGVLEFAGGEKYRIENTSVLRNKLWGKVRAITSARRHPENLRRNHHNPRRCQICEFRTICPQVFRPQTHTVPKQ